MTSKTKPYFSSKYSILDSGKTTLDTKNNRIVAEDFCHSEHLVIIFCHIYQMEVYLSKKKIGNVDVWTFRVFKLSLHQNSAMGLKKVQKYKAICGHTCLHQKKTRNFNASKSKKLEEASF